MFAGQDRSNTAIMERVPGIGYDFSKNHVVSKKIIIEN